MNTEDFYKNLPAVESFSGLADFSIYRNLPDDWIVAVTDIRNSTEAIARGKYRIVNTLGVAVITAMINQAKPIAIPFVFGGDGASVCLPAKFADAARKTLFSVKALAQEFYELDLRVGIVPVRDIQAAGKKVMVAKYRISEYCTQASFAGGGLRFAEDAVKNPEAGFEIREKGSSEGADFSGFECRWSQFQNPAGATASILVRAAPSADEARVYGGVLKKVEEYYGGFEKCHPLKINSMKMALDSEKLEAELNVRTFGKGRKARAAHWLIMRLQILIGIFCMKWKIRFGEINWGKYKEQAIRNADVKKFDDMLRFVVAGGPEEFQRLGNYLEERRLAGDLFYGTHVSTAAIMTCYVVDYAAEHYHFVDGMDGGYAMAAAAMKKQISASAVRMF